MQLLCHLGDTSHTVVFPPVCLVDSTTEDGKGSALEKTSLSEQGELLKRIVHFLK